MIVQQDISRTTRNRRLIALFAGGAAALAMLSVPIPLIEMMVASTGLSEALPAAAPPLGLTARAAMAGFAGLLGMGLSLAIQPRAASEHHEAEESAQDYSEQGENKMGFALSKLTAFTRGRGRAKAYAGDAIEPLPVLRRADSHPDAPARRPIFASRDFAGADIFAHPAPADAAPTADEASDIRDALDMSGGISVDDVADTLAPASEPFDAIDGLVMPRSPEPLDDRIILTDAIKALPKDPVEEAKPIIAREPLDGLSIAQLADRFERGIARRKALVQSAAALRQMETMRLETGTKPMREPRVLADMPPVPRVDVRGDVDAEVDEALRNALGTLQQMTGR